MSGSLPKRPRRIVAAVLAYARANAIALLAIFVALGGTATASHLVVKATDIQANAVRANHIQANSVRQKQAHRGSLSHWFGAGVLGGESKNFGFGAGAGGSHFTSPIGSGDQFDLYGVPAPRRMVIRDLRVRSQQPVTRRVRLRVHEISCTIEVGDTSCFSGNQRSVLERGERFSAEISEHGPDPVEMPEQNYRFAYRVAP